MGPAEVLAAQVVLPFPVPAGMAHALQECSPDLEVLEARAPASHV